jgi:hypothetical protein
MRMRVLHTGKELPWDAKTVAHLKRMLDDERARNGVSMTVYYTNGRDCHADVNSVFASGFEAFFHSSGSGFADKKDIKHVIIHGFMDDEDPSLAVNPNDGPEHEAALEAYYASLETA